MEHRPILLSDQNLYDYEQLRQHLDEGDVDENENLLIYHPMCEVIRISPVLPRETLRPGGFQAPPEAEALPVRRV